MNGDSGAEEDEDEELSEGSGTETSSNSTDSSTTTDSGEESADGDEQATSSSETHSSADEDEEEIDTVGHPEEVSTENNSKKCLIYSYLFILNSDYLFHRGGKLLLLVERKLNYLKICVNMNRFSKKCLISRDFGMSV